MMTMSCGCGLRAGEVVRLKAGDIDFEPKIIWVIQARGRKDCHIMLPVDAHELLSQLQRVVICNIKRLRVRSASYGSQHGSSVYLLQP